MTYPSSKSLDHLGHLGLVARLCKDIQLAQYINDDALGRCLDALYDKGVSCLYRGIGERVVNHLWLDGQATTEDEFGHICIAQGYSRDHHPD
jgi:hypothetical protein